MIAKPPKFGDEAHDCHKMPEPPLEYDNFTQKWHIDMKKTLFLRDVAEISAGYPFRVGLSDDPGGKIRVVQMRDVSPAMGVNWASTVRVQHEANMESYFLRHDDILFVMRGGNYYGTLLANPPDLSLAALHFFRVRVTQPQMILPAFLAWQLGQHQAQRYYNNVEAGSAQKSMRRADFADMPITVLPLNRQKTLLDAVESIQKNIAVLQSGIANCHNLLSAIAGKELAALYKESV